MIFDTLNKAMELGKPSEVIDKLVAQYLYGIAHDEWMITKQSEYNALYPTTREMNSAEQGVYDIEYLSSNSDIDAMPEDFEYPLVDIEYTDENPYMTFGEWLNETEVISEAVEATYDEEGIELTPYIAEVREALRPEPTHEIDIDSFKVNSSEYASYMKVKRGEEVESLVVDVNSVTYDANESAQDRMNRILGVANFKAIQAICQAIPDLAPIYDAVYKQTVPWKGSDNSFHNVQIESIAEATESSLNKLAETWVKYG